MKRDLALLALALGAGILVGYVDLGASEVIVPISMILAFAFILGLIEPRLAWLWGIAVGLGLPLVHFILQLGGSAEPNPFYGPGIIVPILFGLAGAYAGWLVRRVIAAGSEP